ncbi:Cdc37 N terminal kinase binding-domain-containing protein [Mrakia frigida]|uniref:Hsp90 co-chaperone CDC37 n=1 Tax=Mrakia frigida TaxID=29902 RepID=UPI003FCC1B61
MPLNYSKWDQLELSDDSDIEEHPNIDKKSMIRWKQQDIHQKRADRQVRISKLKTEVALNGTLRPRIMSLLTSLTDLPPVQALSTFSNLVQQLRTSPSPDKPNTGAPNQPTYDVMLLHLLEQVTKEATDIKGPKIGEGEEDKMVARLEERLRHHNGLLDARTKECEAELEKEEKESKMKITSEGIHDGFDSGYVNPATPNPMEETKKPLKSKASSSSSAIEVLNPQASTSQISTTSPDSDAEDDELPVATPVALAFLSVPYLDFDKAFEFVQRNPTVMFESTTDALLLEAFNAEIAGDKKKARICVEKGLLVQFCRKLGKDGVRLFFQRMRQGGPGGQKAISIFLKDVTETYDRMAARVIAMNAETAQRKLDHPDEGEEQIQLVAEGGASISFNVPSGPPPETIQLEGEGTEGMDPVDVQKYLMRQWNIFDGFEERMKSALRKESLEEVNKVLGKMGLEEAEKVVGLMNEANILSFQDGGAIRDETKPKQEGGLFAGDEPEEDSDGAELD